MMSESINNSSWATDPTVISNLSPFQSDFQVAQQMGFFWWVTSYQDNRDGGGKGFGINSQYNMFNMGALPNSPLVPTTDGMAFSRPSSQHSGGVGMIFCDGHYQFVIDQIPYNVYTQLMTPNQRAVALDNTKTPVTAQTSSPKWIYTLNEADFN